MEPPSAGDRWELTETNYDSCGELTYALFHQMPQGNSQFATKILMFHDGEYLASTPAPPRSRAGSSGKATAGSKWSTRTGRR
nr:LppP/LprE family lipoprotein [Corynebacterium xerosis]